MDITQKTSTELADMACNCSDENLLWHLIAELHQRGDQAEFFEAEKLSHSAIGRQREIACDILGQLGWEKKSFHDESIAILIRLLNDPEELVIASAAFALGHRNDIRSVTALLPLLDHSNPLVRLGVASGLSALEDPVAVNGLVQLAADSDREVKNWATFGLASRCDSDTPQLRQVLLVNSQSDDCEIRGEALIGLARRKERQVESLILKELQGPLYGNWVIQACSHFASQQFKPFLEKMQQQLGNEIDPRFGEDIEQALAACSAVD